MRSVKQNDAPLRTVTITKKQYEKFNPLFHPKFELQNLEKIGEDKLTRSYVFKRRKNPLLSSIYGKNAFRMNKKDI